MTTLFTIVGFLFLVMETLIGMVASGSIVLINFIDWFQRGKHSPMDLILICLGLSRILLQMVMILNVILFILPNNPVSANTLIMVLGMSIYTNTVNLCFAACLSVFYFTKIAIFSHHVFLQFKRRLSGLVPWLLLGSVIISAVKSIVVTTIWNYDLFACNPYKSLLSNRSNAEMNLPSLCRLITGLNSVLDILPLIVFLSSSIFLIISLWKHMRCMQRNGTGTRDLNTQAHLSAIKALASFAILYLISFAALTSQSVLAWSNQYIWTTMLYSLNALYPSGHAVILILINPKLKQAWVRIVYHLKCCLSKVPS